MLAMCAHWVSPLESALVSWHSLLGCIKTMSVRCENDKTGLQSQNKKISFEPVSLQDLVSYFGSNRSLYRKLFSINVLLSVGF